MRGGRRSGGSRWSAVAEVLANRDLRRLELAWGAFFAVESMSLIGLSVWAYGAGGASNVGLMGLLRLLPGALALPFGAALADRFPRHLVLTAVYAAQAALLAAVAAAVALDGPPAVVYALAVLVGITSAPCRPAQLATTPLLARSPEELVAANVTAGTFEGIGTVLGPALTGLLLALAGSSTALAAAAAVSATAAALVAGLDARSDPTRAARRQGGRVLAGLADGVRQLHERRDLAVVIGSFWAQSFVRGALIVYVVALAITTLGIGDGGVGLLNAAFGAGVLAGALAAAGLVGRRHLGRPFATGLALWGAPLLVAAVWPDTGVAVLALATAGAGNAVLDVAGFTLIQRIADDRTLARVFGVMYVGVAGAAGIGAIAAPALIDLLGLRAALAATAALLPLLALVLLPRLAKVDERSAVPAEKLAAVRRVPLFAPLPPVSLEKLATAAESVAAAPGAAVIREGDRGDAFYVILDGTLRVGSGGYDLRELGPGDCFGEIALMRDVPRTASVTALTGCRLLAVSRLDFLSAVLGTPEAGAAAENVIAGRLGDRLLPALR